MHRLGVVGEPCNKAENVLFHGGGRHGGEDVVVVPGGGGGDDLVSETAASFDSGVSSGSLCSSLSSLTDNSAESSLVVCDRTWSLSSSSSMQLDGDGGGPLYELSPLFALLPVRPGLSKCYQGKSQSFTSLAEAKSVDDLAKKTIPYSSMMKARRGYAASGPDVSRPSISRHVSGPYSKTISKKTMPRGSSDRLLSRARSTGLHSSGKPPAYESKKVLHSTYAS